MILFLSRLHPKKGLEYLFAGLEMIARRRFSLVVAGSGSVEYEAELRCKIDNSPLKGRVHFVGFARDQFKQILLQGADLFALTLTFGEFCDRRDGSNGRGNACTRYGWGSSGFYNREIQHGLGQPSRARGYCIRNHRRSGFTCKYERSWCKERTLSKSRRELYLGTYSGTNGGGLCFGNPSTPAALV